MVPPAQSPERRGLPLLALTVGDPAGIGPEIVAQLLARNDWRPKARLAVLGPRRAFEQAVQSLALSDSPVALGCFEVRGDCLSALESLEDVPAVWIETESAPQIPLGQVSAAGGRAALAALRLGHELASSKRVDALVTAPVNKAALHLAGERVEGQTELLGRWAGVPVEMLAIAGRLRVLLLTRHMPLKRAIEELDPERILGHLRLLSKELQRYGIPQPRLACAGLNPHAGEGGLLGQEEGLLIVPALERARAEGILVEGPESPDTVFLRASQGAFDAVLALYHDQAFIPVKLADPDGGLTLILGLPYLRFSPAHGTAFDIVGRGLAREQNLLNAVLEAARWVGEGAEAGFLATPDSNRSSAPLVP